MARQSFLTIAAIAQDNDARTVTLSALSLSLLETLLAVRPVEIFLWSELSDDERDEADNAIASAVYQLSRSAMLGTVVWSVETTHDGWLPCTGGVYPMENWPELMAVYPADWKNVPSAGYFTAPKLAGRTLVGGGAADYPGGGNFAPGTLAGELNHTLTANEMPAHTHLAYMRPTVVLNGELVPASPMIASPAFGSVSTGSAGGGASHNNMQPYLVLNAFLIGR